LRNVDLGLFVVGFLKPEDYVKPEDFNPEDREVHFVELRMKDKAELLKCISYATN
jgi:hypothetical protein